MATEQQPTKEAIDLTLSILEVVDQLLDDLENQYLDTVADLILKGNESGMNLLVIAKDRPSVQTQDANRINFTTNLRHTYCDDYEKAGAIVASWGKKPNEVTIFDLLLMRTAEEEAGVR